MALTPDLGQACAQLAVEDLLPPELVEAHDLMTRILVAGRLLAPDLQQPTAVAARALAKACGAEGFDHLLDRFRAAREEVAAAWQATFGEKLEIDE